MPKASMSENVYENVGVEKNSYIIDTQNKDVQPFNTGVIVFEKQLQTY